MNVPKNILTILLAGAALTMTATIPEAVHKISSGSLSSTVTPEAFRGVTHGTLPQESTGSLRADFSVEGAEALKPLFTENFDNGKNDWKWDPTEYVTWSVKKMTDNKSIADISPDDAGSLYVDGPYQVFRREKSSAWSPEYTIPAKARLSFHAGYSMNNDDYCRLVLSVCTPTDTIEIWNSKDTEGVKTWVWHPVNIDLGAYNGQKVTFRFMYTWGAEDATFQTGGYMGDFAIDNFTLSQPQSVENISVQTGETVALIDNSEGNPVAWEWTMPGAVPASSTERNPKFYYTADGVYGVTLKVTDAEGNTAQITRDKFVTVTGTSPVAKIIPPATFREAETHRHLIAPLVPVTFTDGSSGFPDSWSWTFSGVDEDNKKVTESTEQNPSVGYSFLHDQYVTLEASNSHGKSAAMADLRVEYSGLANNILSGDNLTVFDMEDWGVFPGSNKAGITAYAERFSKPSRPSVINGVYVFFKEATATELVDQIANIGVHLYTSKDGKPYKCLDSMWWQVTELDISPSSTSLVGTAFPFTEAPVVDDEFFIVIDGIPEFKEGCKVSFAMAEFRDHDNSALILKDGKWIEASEYFGADKQTSFMIKASLIHSVMSPLPAGSSLEKTVGKASGHFDFPIFSYMGYQEPVSSDAEWLRVGSTANGLTVDTLSVVYDALPEGVDTRTGHLTLTDGASKMVLTVNQDKNIDSAVEAVVSDSDMPVGIFSIDGRSVYASPVPAADAKAVIDRLPRGLYIVRQGNKSARILKH